MKKFRAWDIADKKYIYKLPKGFSIDLSGNVVVLIDGEPHVSDEFILEQSTNVLDKNDNLIYEGDIVELSDGDTHIKSTVGEHGVVDTEGLSCPSSYTLVKWLAYEWYVTMEIKGNIHKFRGEYK